MEDLKIGLERDNGEFVGYHIDTEVLNGLYLTYEVYKVQENISSFNIDIRVNPNQPETNISKRDRVSIITILFDEEKQFQYLVGGDLDLKEFEALDQSQMPEMIRELILDAYKLATSNRLSDLI